MGKRFRSMQGMDERLLTDEKCEVIFNSVGSEIISLLFDNIKDRRILERKTRSYTKTYSKNTEVLCFLWI